MHAISSYRGNRLTNTHPQTNKTNPQTGPITIHCAAARSVMIRKFPVTVTVGLIDKFRSGLITDPEKKNCRAWKIQDCHANDN